MLLLYGIVKMNHSAFHAPKTTLDIIHSTLYLSKNFSPPFSSSSNTNMPTQNSNPTMKLVWIDEAMKGLKGFRVIKMT
jgi:hypothetical protein